MVPVVDAKPERHTRRICSGESPWRFGSQQSSMRVPDVDTAGGPPIRLPLAHVVVAFVFLLAGLVTGLLVLFDQLTGLARLAPLHLLLLGWVCVTIMGAMVQFVPVWSGVALHSCRLAAVALGLVTAGVVGLAAAALLGRTQLFVTGIVAVAGIWLFVYTLGRTLPVRDVTERHFAYALCALAVAVGLGGLLAVDLATGLVATAGVSHAALRSAHVTLAVLGGVLLTVVGALFQLGPMFAGDGDRDARSRRLGRVEEGTLPVGVVLLAAGRGLHLHPVAAAGGVLVVVGVLAASAALLRTIASGRAESTVTARRYLLTGLGLLLWALLAGPALVTKPLATGVVGPPAATWSLAVALAAVLVGTLYHVVPFLVWDHRYADRLGYEPVPMVDDLYDSRLARVDLLALSLGGGVLVFTPLVGVDGGVVVGAVTAALALALAVLSLGSVLWRHLPGDRARSAQSS